MTFGTVEAVKALAGGICWCGKRKTAKESFCPECYHKLPRDLQRGLYKSLADGYVPAYLTARRWFAGGHRGL